MDCQERERERERKRERERVTEIEGGREIVIALTQKILLPRTNMIMKKYTYIINTNIESETAIARMPNRNQQSFSIATMKELILL